MTTTPELRTSARMAQALPDPGERIPTLSWPIVAIFTGALATFAVSAWAAVTDVAHPVVTIALAAAAIFVLFTVLHDAAHYSISTHRWVNVAFGRVAMFFVSPLLSFRSFAFIHIEHHRNTNDGDNDPDHFVSAAPHWQLPVRFALMDVPYLRFLLKNLSRRPRAELLETAGLMTFTASAIAVAVATGHFWTLAVVFLIPGRVAMFVLAWWFDWLPHHDIEETQQENRYRATRNRVGSEWILTPLLLSQNYHLVHHLHPSIPFHRYVAAWKRNEESYLERDARIDTVFGAELDAHEYREWKRLNGALGNVLPVRMPARSSATRPVAHPVTVAAVERLTPDSVLVRLDVPEELREEFAFQPGQHLTVCGDFGGETLRRSYSICSAATSGDLEIAVKQIDGGVFSTHVVEQLEPGDTLELMTPSGSFGTSLDPLAANHYVALVAGSGITPVISILESVLVLESDSRFTLYYGNRDAESTMFRARLEALESRFADRLRIVHVHSRNPAHPAAQRGRIDAAKMERWTREDLDVADVAEWFLCGPVDMVRELRDDLLGRGVDVDRVHVELFHGFEAPSTREGFDDAQVTVALGGEEHALDLAAGDTVLETALQAGLDAPYACLGGACGTCRAKVVTGEVRMEQNFALSAADVDAGYVLTCQSRPTVPSVRVDYDG
ncbi:fatty acid desaturase [Aeromicrobium halocynthiae]|uniref:Fatty acid desaturase n=1 Tax=Aeromicrobium halocynthiae TaxID=560557 RepID=A0ABN2W0L7_9ACTN